ncbi:MAG: ATP-dependent RecD-like DNA helicase, partial [Acidimicrobiia bacterium]
VMAVIGDLATGTAAPILGTALAARAAAGLEAATRIPSATLTRFLGETRDRGGLPRGAIVVVDEAGMVGTGTLAALSELVEDARGKLILVGDHRQLPEIEAGGLFRALATRLPVVELTENVRQQEPWEQEALAELRDGSVSRAVDAYRERRRVVLGSSPEETLERAVGDWYHHVEASGDLEGTLLVAHSNATVAELNDRARDLMARAGRLRGATLKAGEQTYQAGDRVLCRKNRTRLRVLNGDLGTVVDVDPKPRSLTVQLDRNGETRVLPAWYLADGHLGYGYALTGHKAQGVTVRRSFTVAGVGADREWTYVTMSRGREANTLYLASPDPEENRCTHLAHQQPEAARGLAQALERTTAQVAAIDHGDRRSPDPNDVHSLGPPPPGSDVAARAAWLMARRRITRDLERQRQGRRGVSEREPRALGIGR